jgi:nitronate monooxygenase
VLAATDDLSADIDAVLRAAAGRPLGVNFLMPSFDRALLDVVVPRVPLVEWYWGLPDPVLVSVAHDAGALAAWQVGSKDEAVAAADAGCDLIVAQGIEAGGHVRGTIGLLPLLDAVAVPVVAAGGIGTARGVAAVLAAGVSAARIGTRFAATLESGDVGGDGEPFPIPRFAVRPPNRTTRGRIDAMALYAGQSVGAVTAIVPVAEVVRELAVGAERLLRAVGALPPEPGGA